MRGKEQTNELPFIGALFKCHIQDLRWRRVSCPYSWNPASLQAGLFSQEILGQLRILANTVSKGLYLAWPLYSECHHYRRYRLTLWLKHFSSQGWWEKESVHSGEGGIY